MIWRLTSSSHCRCLSLLAMSSGVSPASLAKHTQKHRIHWFDTFYKPGRIRTSFASCHHILYSWLPVLDFILQTRQSQVYPDSLLTIDAGRDLREEIPWHRFTLPHTTARPHMALLSLLPLLVGQIVNNRTTTELQTLSITKLTSPSSQNKNMVWEHPPDQTRSLGILKEHHERDPVEMPHPNFLFQQRTTSGDFICCIPMSIDAFLSAAVWDTRCCPSGSSNAALCFL